MTFRLLACVAFLIARAEADDGYDQDNQCFKSLEAYDNASPPNKEFFENPWGIVAKPLSKTEGSEVTKRYATLDHACGRYCGKMAETSGEETLVKKKIIFKACVTGGDAIADCNDWIPTVSGVWQTNCTDPKQSDGIAIQCKKSKPDFFKKIKKGETYKYPAKLWMFPSLYQMLEYEAMDYMLCSSVADQIKPRCDWGYNSGSKFTKKSLCDPTSLPSCCGSGSGFEGELATQPQAMANESNGVAAMVVVAVAAVAGIVGVVGMALKKGSITKPMTTTDV